MRNKLAIVCAFLACIALGMAVDAARAVSRQLDRMKADSRSLQVETKALAIELCWKLGADAVIAPPPAATRCVERTQ